jgi:hypothetical protein
MTHHLPLSDQVLHHVHHKQRMAFRAGIDDGRESGGHLAPQTPGQVGRHHLAGEQFQAQFHRLSPSAQLAHEVPQGVLPDGGLHRAIGP